MINDNMYIIPTPILDSKEQKSVDELTKRYDKLCEPGVVSKAKERLVKFKDVFSQVGKKLTQKTIAKSIPVISGVIGALFDSAQMQQVLEYADVFYNKRFLLEKEQRINMLVGNNDCIFDVEFEESACDVNEENI